MAKLANGENVTPVLKNSMETVLRQFSAIFEQIPKNVERIAGTMSHELHIKDFTPAYFGSEIERGTSNINVPCTYGATFQYIS